MFSIRKRFFLILQMCKCLDCVWTERGVRVRQQRHCDSCDDQCTARVWVQSPHGLPVRGQQEPQLHPGTILPHHGRMYKESLIY